MATCISGIPARLASRFERQDAIDLLKEPPPGHEKATWYPLPEDLGRRLAKLGLKHPAFGSSPRLFVIQNKLYVQSEDKTSHALKWHGVSQPWAARVLGVLVENALDGAHDDGLAEEVDALPASACTLAKGVKVEDFLPGTVSLNGERRKVGEKEIAVSQLYFNVDGNDVVIRLNGKDEEAPDGWINSR
jgi:hypothetical protein